MPPPEPSDLAGRLRHGLAACGVGAEERLLVAVSGGVDSVVLLHLLAEAGQPLVAAHVDHGLRADAAADGEMVDAVCQRLGVPHVRLAVTVEPGNVQDRARAARYAALADAARQHGCAAVATGHTATDQAETVLMALVRGAGLRGLAGMPRRRPLAEGVDLVRPLLDVSRAEVEGYAARYGLEWREDPSNQLDVFRRNRLRRSMMEALRAEGGDETDRRIAAAAGYARSGLGVVTNQLDAVVVADRQLSLAGLATLAGDARRAVLAEAVARWAPEAPRSQALVDRLAALVEAPVGTCVESGGLRAWRQRDALRFDTGEETSGPAGTLVVTPLPSVPSAFDGGPWTETVDADRAADVRVRPWRDGDRIRPLGLGGSQLVSDLLRQRGVARPDRAAVPVVVPRDEAASSQRGGVLWVVGHRLAASVAVGPETTRAARWSWHAADRPG